jgi:hypothetical protein
MRPLFHPYAGRILVLCALAALLTLTHCTHILAVKPEVVTREGTPLRFSQRLKYEFLGGPGTRIFRSSKPIRTQDDARRCFLLCGSLLEGDPEENFDFNRDSLKVTFREKEEKFLGVGEFLVNGSSSNRDYNRVILSAKKDGDVIRYRVMHH